MIKAFESDFLNTILDHFNDYRYKFGKLTTQEFPFRDLVKTPTDKYIWNCIVTDNKFLDVTNLPLTIDKLYNKISSSETCYTEWIKAFYKISQRWLEERISNYYGSYSALHYYLNNCVGNRKFRFDGEFGYLWFEYNFEEDKPDDSYMLNGSYADKINCLISAITPDHLSGPDLMIYYLGEDKKQKIKSWLDHFVIILDSLIPEIKGTDKISKQDYCYKYSKNCMEYMDEKLYSFFNRKFNLDRWGDDNSDEYRDEHTFTYIEEELSVQKSERYNYHNEEYDLHFHLIDSGFRIHFEGTIPFNLTHTDEENKNIIDFLSFYTKFHHCNGEKTNKDLLLKTYLRFNNFSYSKQYIEVYKKGSESDTSQDLLYKGPVAELVNMNIISNYYVTNTSNTDSVTVIKVLPIPNPTVYPNHYYNKGKEVWCSEGTNDAICVIAETEEAAIRCCEINNKLEEIYPG